MDDKQVVKKKRKNMLIGFSIFAVLAVLIAGAYFLGFIYAGIKNTNESVVLRTTVCSRDVVESFNTVFNQVPSSQEDIQRIKSEQIKKSNEIAQFDGMRSDPTCLYIALQGAFIDYDEPRAKEYVGLISDLAQKNVFADTTLSGLSSISILKSRADTLSQARVYSESVESTGDILPKDL